MTNDVLSLRFVLSVLLATPALAACGSAFEHPTPSGFVELNEDSDRYDYRATSADGVVLSVRALDHDPEGELSFWSRAIQNQLRYHSGYALLEEHEVESADGLEGVQLRFGHDQDDAPHQYFVTIFPTEDTLFLLEAGGTTEEMDRHSGEIQWAVENFSAR